MLLLEVCRHISAIGTDASVLDHEGGCFHDLNCCHGIVPLVSFRQRKRPPLGGPFAVLRTQPRRQLEPPLLSGAVRSVPLSLPLPQVDRQPLNGIRTGSKLPCLGRVAGGERPAIPPALGGTPPRQRPSQLRPAAPLYVATRDNEQPCTRRRMREVPASNRFGRQAACQLPSPDRRRSRVRSQQAAPTPGYGPLTNVRPAHGRSARPQKGTTGPAQPAVDGMMLLCRIRQEGCRPARPVERRLRPPSYSAAPAVQQLDVPGSLV